MKSNFKRAMSLVLTVLMVFTVVPFSSFAAGEWDCASNGHKYEYTNFKEGLHNWTCSECDAYGIDKCEGGTATCKDKAVCEKCNTAYGELSKTHGATTLIQKDDYLKTPADCQNAAVYYLVCTICENKTDETQTVGLKDPNAHKYSVATSNGDGTHKAKCEYENCKAEISNVPCSGGTATCTEKATCIYCKGQYGEPNGHDFSKKVTNDANKATLATCTAAATYYYTCQNCDVVSTVDTYSDGELKAHDFTKEEADKEKYLASEGTCQENEEYYKSCSVCGLSSKGTEQEATFTGDNKGQHKWGTYTDDNNATCENNATKTAKCDVPGCDATNSIEIEGTKLGHNFVGTDIKDDSKNLREAATCTSQATYWKACTNEGCTAFANEETAPDAYFAYGDLASHIYGKKVETDEYNRTDATCIAKATRWFACTGCEKSANGVEGQKEAFYEYGELKDHDYTKKVLKAEYVVEGHEPTCTSDGIYYYACSQEGCGKSAKDDSTLEEKQYYVALGSATGHQNVESYDGKDPTCTEDGYSDYKICKDCGTYLKDKEVRKSTGHKEYIAVERLEPTCNKVGHTEEKRCAVCEQLLSVPSMTLSALGHIDEDGDEICDREGCGTVVKEEDKCTCICHQSGIMSIVYIFVRLIWKLIGANPYCDCGIQHY